MRWGPRAGARGRSVLRLLGPVWSLRCCECEQGMGVGGSFWGPVIAVEVAEISLFEFYMGRRRPWVVGFAHIEAVLLPKRLGLKHPSKMPRSKDIHGLCQSLIKYLISLSYLGRYGVDIVCVLRDRWQNYWDTLSIPLF